MVEKSSAFNRELELTIISNFNTTIGTLDGTLTVWDLSTQVAKITTKPGSGILKLAWRSTNILAATLEGLVRVIDPRSGNVLADCSGHLAPILDFALSR
jgi:WD40 repeat protein